MILGEASNFLSLITMFYFANLVTNQIYAFAQTKHSYLLPIGLFLFILCDVFVGLSVLESSFLPIPEDSLIHKINEIGLNMAWVFYVPSQTLIALSVNEDKLLRHTDQANDTCL